MKNHLFAWFLFFAGSASISMAPAQEMSSHLIRSICQDDRGFIWIATEYGLNKWDGITCKQYLHDDGDSTSVADNNVHKLLIDSDHRLWLCCINGLQRYDAGRDAFVGVRFPEDVKPHVTDLKEFKEEFWIATSGRGLFRLKKGASEASPLTRANRLLGDRVVSCIYEDRRRTIWIGTINNRSSDDGLFRIDPRNGQAVAMPGVPDHNINAMAEDGAGRLYVGTSNAVLRYDTLAGQFVPVPCRDEARISVRCMATGADGRVLVGTEGQGLQCIDDEGRGLFTVDDARLPFDFRRARIHALMEDRNGHWWAGCFQRGIFQVSNRTEPFDFRSFQDEAAEKGGFPTSICKDAAGGLWCGLTDEGIFRLHADGTVGKHFREPQTAVCLFEDSRGRLWVGSYDQARLALVDKQSGRCRWMAVPQGGYIKTMVEDRRKRLYLSTFGSGFVRYNLQTDVWEKIELHDRDEGGLTNFWINTLLCDSRGWIWMGHYEGVSCYDPEQDRFVREPYMDRLSGQITLSMLEDRAGGIWLGTYNGLFRIDRSTGAVRNYTTANGLSNNVICGLVEDEAGHIWCSTFQGISQLKVKEGTVVNYQSGNGLRDKVYSRGVYFHDRETGRVYFGGNTGITSFLPNRIPAGDYRCNIVTTALYIHNQPVGIRTRSGGQPVMDTGVDRASAFRFAYEDNTFTFEFATMDFIDPQNVHYEYRLKELSDTWSATLPGVNRIAYNHLPSGHYTLEIRACKYGSHSPAKRLTLRIEPPWYQSRPAWIAYLLLLVAAILLVVYALNKKRKEMLNEAKLRFFIDISHEIRSPMTLIIHPLEKLLKNETDAATRKALAAIDRNARRILGLINQLLDVRKIDKGQMHLTFSETDLVGFIAELMDVFEEQAAARNIRLRFEPATEKLPVWIDRNNFDKVLMNLLSNAFRFTPDGGAIDLSLTASSRYAEIRISDNGPGIPEEQIEKIFTRFYQTSNRLSFGSLGSGIGLHLSRTLVELHQGTITAGNRKSEGGGSCFTIRLPLGNSHIRKENLKTNPSDALLLRRPFFAPPVDEKRKTIRSRTNHKILIVDDEPEVRHLLRQELEPSYRVLTAGNGKEALQLALAKSPDVIVADVLMPEMDGLELVKHLRSNSNISHIPLILLSSKAERSDRIRGLDKGADAYLTKPFDMEELILMINNLINNRRMMKGKFSGAQDQEGKLKAVNFKTANERLMERVMSIINKHLDDSELSVEQLASKVGLSRVQLHRKLKEITGIPAGDFIRNLRLKKAAELLREKKMNISQIAYAVGFANQTHFSTSFRKFYGVSPTAYIASFESLPPT
jgi:signal transduction histidine kinase/ligand-binding sensor domain-containing protein/DNA-binding response OmpR family regulator